jgi:hypothetical protein
MPDTHPHVGYDDASNALAVPPHDVNQRALTCCKERNPRLGILLELRPAGTLLGSRARETQDLRATAVI